MYEQNPQMFQNMAQQQGMGGMGGMGGMPGMGGLGGMGGMGGGLGGMSGMGGGLGGNVGANVGLANNNADPAQTPEQRFAEQLNKLEEMGLTNREVNLQVLQQCNGNLELAIERLFNIMG